MLQVQYMVNVHTHLLRVHLLCRTVHPTHIQCMPQAYCRVDPDYTNRTGLVHLIGNYLGNSDHGEMQNNNSWICALGLNRNVKMYIFLILARHFELYNVIWLLYNVIIKLNAVNQTARIHQESQKC